MYVSLPVVDDLTCVRERDIFAQITTKKTFCVGDKSGKSPCNGMLLPIYDKTQPRLIHGSVQCCF